MLVPLYEAAYDRLEVGTGTRLLGLGCGSGLALLVAASRGASVVGVEDDEELLSLAGERLRPDPVGGTPHWDGRLLRGRPDEPVRFSRTARTPNVVTAFHARPYAGALADTTAALERGTPVVLAGWGPAERCAAASALRVAARLADPASTHWAPGGRDDLEELALRSGLRLDGSGRVACPFGYADMASAVRGLLSTGLYDAAVRETDEQQVLKELTEALHPYQRSGGTVWMPNLFRYVIARTV